jgi:hypothetical protein
MIHYTRYMLLFINPFYTITTYLNETHIPVVDYYHLDRRPRVVSCDDFLQPLFCTRKRAYEGRAMAQVVSRLPLTAEARVRARVNPCGIGGGQSGPGTGFSPSSSVFPCQYIIPPSLTKLISSGERVIC